jgi:hypothetical protein
VNRPMVLITQLRRDLPGVVVAMRVMGQTIVLEGAPNYRRRQFLVVAELESEDEASALFEVINQRIAAFDARVTIASSSTPTRRSEDSG